VKQMRGPDYRWNADRPSDSVDDLDRLIDTALSRFGAVEERRGLEERILANLRDQKSTVQPQWWAWSLPFAAVAMVIVGILWHFAGWTQPSIANQPAPQQRTIKSAIPPHANDRVARNAAPVRKHVVLKTVVKKTNPKLDQFPSPRPMSEQERILAMYINQDPEHAALIAEARMEALRQDEAEKVRAVSADDQVIGR
jgi:hypothetical protein